MYITSIQRLCVDIRYIQLAAGTKCHRRMFLLTWSVTVVVKVFNAESPWALDPKDATHVVVKGRQGTYDSSADRPADRPARSRELAYG